MTRKNVPTTVIGKTCIVPSEVPFHDTMEQACNDCPSDTEKLVYSSPRLAYIMASPLLSGAKMLPSTGKLAGKAGATAIAVAGIGGSIFLAGLGIWSSLSAGFAGTMNAANQMGWGTLALPEIARVPWELGLLGAAGSGFGGILGVYGSSYLTAKGAEMTRDESKVWVENMKEVSDWMNFFEMKKEIPSCIRKNFKSLKSINADWVGLDNLDNLEGMYDLEKISAVQNNIRELPNLDKFYDLKVLNLQATNLPAIECDGKVINKQFLKKKEIDLLRACQKSGNIRYLKKRRTVKQRLRGDFEYRDEMSLDDRLNVMENKYNKEIRQVMPLSELFTKTMVSNMEALENMPAKSFTKTRKVGKEEAKLTLKTGPNAKLIMEYPITRKTAMFTQIGNEKRGEYENIFVKAEITKKGASFTPSCTVTGGEVAKCNTNMIFEECLIPDNVGESICAHTSGVAKDFYKAAMVLSNSMAKKVNKDLQATIPVLIKKKKK